jgi:hypothetical protein
MNRRRVEVERDGQLVPDAGDRQHYHVEGLASGLMLDVGINRRLRWETDASGEHDGPGDDCEMHITLTIMGKGTEKEFTCTK